MSGLVLHITADSKSCVSQRCAFVILFLPLLHTTPICKSFQEVEEKINKSIYVYAWVCAAFFRLANNKKNNVFDEIVDFFFLHAFQRMQEVILFNIV